MKNSDMPSMPISCVTKRTNGKIQEWTNYKGITKREMFAMHAMQAILANGASEEIGYTDWAENLAKHAITAVDALLKELEK